MSAWRAASCAVLLNGLVLACGDDPSAEPAPAIGAGAGSTAPVVSSGGAGAAGAAMSAAGSGGGAAGQRASSPAGSPAAAGSRAGAAGSSGTSSAAGAAAGSGAAGSRAASGAGGAGAGAAGAAGMMASAGASGAAGNTQCEFPDPPADIAGWVDESWNAQLGNNIRTRKAWILDNVMLNKGSINLCVRWGATSAVTDSVRMNIAATTERWFNDWFKGLGSYGCFPYGAGIKVKITGWAVRPGMQSLLGAVDPAIPVYTETDAEGEPKCPDACSSFVHWDHKFTGCMGGDANHSDYWLWFDDRLPGGGGAAAVGGDWGLRMPVSTFVNALDRPSFNITEHEMGHGFGMQDYYDWTGAKPKGGSIMIVGSTPSEAPTAADHWLLKRTWKEMKKLRGW